MFLGLPDLDPFRQRYESGPGSFPFLIKVVLNGLKYFLQYKIFTQNLKKKNLRLKILKILYLRVNYKKKNLRKKMSFASLKSVKKGVGSGVGSRSEEYKFN
jgi:hypothetical protein